ncbi:MAG: winged helix-turn-helix domain-containing protein, partial [Gammaproteobacteria bacterium]|nr:winged helix-turn-helix domain-containing protein [Gammaproteobacteria bacterium]
MAIPDFQSVMRPVLEALADGQARSLTQIHDFVVERFQLPPDEIREKLNSGRQTIIRNRVGWSRTYLNKAGLLEIPERGLSQITDRGR